ncbi:MAG: DEAD/DEAH box helicase [Methanobacteriota archaeon]
MLAAAPQSVLRPGAFEPRTYQERIAAECARRSTLVILPTGLGKTSIAARVAGLRLASAGGRVLVLAPTKPLVEQHARTLAGALEVDDVAVFTGDARPEERKARWQAARVVVSTPQVIENDLLAGRLDLSDVTLLVVDEAHRAVGNYAYVHVARELRREAPAALVLALTASPGSSRDRVLGIVENLGIEGIEVRARDDEDVRDHVQRVVVDWIEVRLPEPLRRVASDIRAMLESRVERLRRAGAVRGPRVGKRDLLEVRRRLQARLAAGGDEADACYDLLRTQAEAMKLHHALELAETQGLRPLRSYLSRLPEDESAAARAIREDPRFGPLVTLVDDCRVEHPKLRRLAGILRAEFSARPDAKVLVFSQYRETADRLTAELAAIEGVRVARFVGQGKRGGDKGLTQKRQVELLDQLRGGALNVLVATSVGEEGLDVPSTDLVVFYEPVPSEIRTIQRRGRTGRNEAGRVVILMTKGTQDEAAHWIARNKEQRMATLVRSLAGVVPHVNASLHPPGAAGALPSRREATLPSEVPEAPRILVDTREFSSAVVKELVSRGAEVDPQRLVVGDFVVSDRVAIERKTGADFVGSLIDGRLFPQLKVLRDHYSSAILVVEGNAYLSARRLKPEAVFGAFAAIVTDLRVPVFLTADASETARLMVAIARREQFGERRPVALRGEKPAKTTAESQQLVIEGLPGVSAVLAERLLSHFGSVEAVARASVAALADVDGIGEKTAARIREVFVAPFEAMP